METRRPVLVSLLLTAGAKIAPGLVTMAVKLSGYITGQEIAFLLIHHGAGVRDVGHEDDKTALSWAVYVNNMELIQELLRVGADPWAVSNNVLDTASEDVKKLIDKTRYNVPDLELLCNRSIRISLLQSNNKSSFHQKLRELHLPSKLLKCIS